MVHTAVLWNWIFLTLSLRYATEVSWGMMLAVVVELLASVFFVVGMLAFFYAWWKQRQAVQAPIIPPPDQVKMDSRQQPGLSLVSFLILIVPAVVLLLAGSLPYIKSPPVPNPTPPILSPTKPGNTPTSITSMLPSNALVAPGKLTVGTSTIFPEQAYSDPQTNKPAGFDIDLINAVAQNLKLKINFVVMEFGKLKESLNNKKVDVVIAAYSLTSGVIRSFKYVPYLAPHEVVLTLKSTPTISKFVTLTDLCGRNIGVLKSSNEEFELQNTQCRQNSPITIAEKQSVDELGKALASGQVDATYQDSPSSLSYAKTYPQQFQAVGSLPGQQEGMLIRSDNASMFQAIQAAFGQLMNNDTYNQLLNKWNLTGDALPSPGAPSANGKTPEAVWLA